MPKTELEWFAEVDLCEGSRLSQREYCTKRGLDYREFSHWRKRYLANRRKEQTKQLSMIEVRPYNMLLDGSPDPSSTIEVFLTKEELWPDIFTNTCDSKQSEDMIQLELSGKVKLSFPFSYSPEKIAKLCELLTRRQDDYGR